MDVLGQMKYKKIEGLISSFAILWGIAHFVRQELVTSDLSQTYIWVAGWLRDMGYFGFLLAILSFGSYLWGRGHKKKSCVNVIVGTAVGAVVIVFAFKSIKIFQENLDLAKLPPNLQQAIDQAYTDDSLPIETRHLVTREHAKSNFVLGLEIVQYVGMNGALMDYPPTLEDEKLREESLQNLSITTTAIKGLHLAIQHTIAIMFFSLILRYMISVWSNRRHS